MRKLNVSHLSLAGARACAQGTFATNAQTCPSDFPRTNATNAVLSFSVMDLSNLSQMSLARATFKVYKGVSFLFPLRLRLHAQGTFATDRLSRYAATINRALRAKFAKHSTDRMRRRAGDAV